MKFVVGKNRIHIFDKENGVLCSERVLKKRFKKVGLVTRNLNQLERFVLFKYCGNCLRIAKKRQIEIRNLMKNKKDNIDKYNKSVENLKRIAKEHYESLTKIEKEVLSERFK